MEKESQPASDGSFFWESQKVFFRQKREELGKNFGPRTFNLESQESGVYLSYERCQCERSFFAGFLFRSSFYWSKKFFYGPGCICQVNFFSSADIRLNFNQEKRGEIEKKSEYWIFILICWTWAKNTISFFCRTPQSLSLFFIQLFCQKKKKNLFVPFFKLLSINLKLFWMKWRSIFWHKKTSGEISPTPP